MACRGAYDRQTRDCRGCGYAWQVALFSHPPVGMTCGASISAPCEAAASFAGLAKAPAENCGRNSDLGVVSLISFS